jgi:hypothetical protein
LPPSVEVLGGGGVEHNSVSRKKGKIEGRRTRRRSHSVVGVGGNVVQDGRILVYETGEGAIGGGGDGHSCCQFFATAWLPAWIQKVRDYDAIGAFELGQKGIQAGRYGGGDYRGG